MTTMRFCYHCGTSHPEEDMRLMVTKSGKRWRCIKSIKGVKKTVAERDAFGKEISKENHTAASLKQRGRLSRDP